MHRFAYYRPKIVGVQYGPEPSLLDIIERYYSDMDDPQAAAKAYINAWMALERAERADELAESHSCRDRLRNLIQNAS